jgi:8-oxo-dGTP pyrophosphatase MutT (NUDIX family)
VLLDDHSEHLLLVDHIKAQCILPTGGHVDDLEDPRISVAREAAEELDITARFHHLTGDRPIFLSITQTRGSHSHIDVTLWFVLAANRHDEMNPHLTEFDEIHWLPLRETDWTAKHYDPHMARFADKLATALDQRTGPPQRI